MEGSTLIQSLVGLVLARIVYDAVAKGWPAPLSAEQSKALGELNAKLGLLKSQLQAAKSPGSFLTQYQSMRNTQQVARYFMQYGVDELTGGRSLGIQFLESSYNDLQFQQTALTGNVCQTWKEVERFDYTKIGWE